MLEGVDHVEGRGQGEGLEEVGGVSSEKVRGGVEEYGMIGGGRMET